MGQVFLRAEPLKTRRPKTMCLRIPIWRPYKFQAGPPAGAKERSVPPFSRPPNSSTGPRGPRNPANCSKLLFCCRRPAPGGDPFFFSLSHGQKPRRKLAYPLYLTPPCLPLPFNRETSVFFRVRTNGGGDRKKLVFSSPALPFFLYGPGIGPCNGMFARRPKENFQEILGHRPLLGTFTNTTFTVNPLSLPGGVAGITAAGSTLYSFKPLKALGSHKKRA